MVWFLGCSRSPSLLLDADASDASRPSSSSFEFCVPGWLLMVWFLGCPRSPSLAPSLGHARRWCIHWPRARLLACASRTLLLRVPSTTVSSLVPWHVFAAGTRDGYYWPRCCSVPAIGALDNVHWSLLLECTCARVYRCLLLFAAVASDGCYWPLLGLRVLLVHSVRVPRLLICVCC